MMLLNVTQNDQKCYNAVADPREGPGGPAFPPPSLFLYQNKAQKGRKKFFADRPPPLISESGWPPPHLKVWKPTNVIQIDQKCDKLQKLGKKITKPKKILKMIWSKS